jgi:hypothetical protein
VEVMGRKIPFIDSVIDLVIYWFGLDGAIFFLGVF